MKINIENFRFINNPEIPRFKAITDIVLDESIIIRDIKLIEHNNELFIAMPCRKVPSGEYKDICHPTEIGCRNEIERAIKEQYKYGMYSAGFKEELKITEIKLHKVDTNSELKAVASVLFNNKFVVHDIKLVERITNNENQKRFELYMPTKKVNEEFVNIVNPTNETLYTEIFNKILDKYKGI